MSKFKVGDVVTSSRTVPGVISAGKGYLVVGHHSLGAPLVLGDHGSTWWAVGPSWSLSASISPNDTVRLKSGEPFTDGSYTAEVDSTKGDIVLLKIGSWLPVDAVEKVEALRLEVGKTYVAANGESVGPMLAYHWVSGGFVRELGDGYLWNHDGSCTHATRGPLSDWRLIREVPAAEPAAETKPKFKVGDRVRALRESCCVDMKGKDGTVRKINANGVPLVDFGADGDWWQNVEDLELVASAKPSDLESLVVTLSVDASSLSRDLADQFQRIADALRAA